jgi:diguanylate cyclase (GGDEF)-like protein
VLRRLHSWMEAQPPWLVHLMTLSLFALVALSDFLTSPQITTSIFYVAPIAVSAWFAGNRAALAIAALCALSWSIKDGLWRDYAYAEPWILFWNGFARLATFVLIAFLILELRARLQREQRLAQRDELTDALNRRAFHEQMEQELARRERSGIALSLVYIDVDRFKLVNDRHGHAEGDRALVEISRTMRAGVRRTDHLARLGGDEFAILLSGAGEQDAERVLTKLLAALRACARSEGWPVDFSVGLVTLAPAVQTSAEAFLRTADEAMYRVKATGRGGHVHFRLTEEGIAPAALGAR